MQLCYHGNRIDDVIGGQYKEYQFTQKSLSVNNMPKERPKTRKEQREVQKKNYIAGKARRPYSHTPTLDKSLEEDGNSDSSVEDVPSANNVCPRCLPILVRYKEVFEGLTQHGPKLKRCKTINPHPSKPERAHYRDLVKQNDWMRENLLDGMGNFLFCARCICSAFSISQQHLCRQREIKRQLMQQYEWRKGKLKKSA